jgi:hypothetical protein
MEEREGVERECTIYFLQELAYTEKVSGQPTLLM